jgi:hypothetical protein
MTEAQAHQFAEFIKDHDKRFEAKARLNGSESAVELTLASDGTVLEPISDVSQYQQSQIDVNDPGPTVKTAFEAWQARTHGG